MTGLRVAAVILLAGIAGGSRASAQDAASLLNTRLDPALRRQVEQVITTARADSLPVAPLVDKALEGTSKRAPAARILAAVQALAGHLGAARHALGAGATAAEITIGAEALRAGASPETLRNLRAAAGTRSLTMPLTVLSTLVERGVPVDTAVTAVTTLENRQAPDQDFLELQHAVERDIGAGLPPGTAAEVRATAHATPGPPSTPARGGHARRPSSRP